MSSCLQDLGSDLSCLVRVSLYVASMEEYPEINRAYTKYFGLNPPVRVCVALGPESLPKGEEFPLIEKEQNFWNVDGGGVWGWRFFFF